MPVTLGLVSAGIGAGTAIYGAIQKKKAERAAAANTRPKYSIPNEEYDALNLAEGQANMGMGAGARQQLQNNTDRAIATTANATLMGGGDANAIGNIVDKSQNAYNNNAVYDDQVRLANLSRLQSNYQRMAANRDKQWQAQQLQTSGMNMFGGGLASTINGFAQQNKDTIPAQSYTPSNQAATQMGQGMAVGGGIGGASNYGGYSQNPFRFDQNPGGDQFQWNGYYPTQNP